MFQCAARRGSAPASEHMFKEGCVRNALCPLHSEMLHPIGHQSNIRHRTENSSYAEVLSRLWVRDKHGLVVELATLGWQREFPIRLVFRAEGYRAITELDEQRFILAYHGGQQGAGEGTQQFALRACEIRKRRLNLSRASVAKSSFGQHAFPFHSNTESVKLRNLRQARWAPAAA